MNLRKSETLAALIILLALGLQIWMLSYVTIWYDEAVSIRSASFPLLKLIKAEYYNEFNPPLYFLLLKVWKFVFSDSEIFLRSLSILISTINLIIVYSLAKLWGDDRSGIFALVLVAFHSFFIDYAVQIRMYPLLIFFTLLSFYIYTKFTNSVGHKRQTLYLFLLTCSIVFSFYTHYFGILVLLGIMVFSSYHLFILRDRNQVYVFLVLFMSFILMIPGGILAMNQVNTFEPSRWIFDQLDMNTLLILLSGNGSYSYIKDAPLRILLLPAVLFGFIVLFRNNKKHIAIPIMIVIFLSVLSLWLMSIINLNVSSRYLIHISLLILILAASSLIKTKDYPSRILGIFGLIIISASVYYGFNEKIQGQYKYSNPNWKQVAQIVMKAKEDNEPVVIMGWDAIPVGYYLNDDFISSFQFEEEINSLDKAESYIVIDSKFARKFNFLKTSFVIYNQPDDHVQILRYYP